MKTTPLAPLGVALCLLLLGIGPVHAQQHRATHLGNPATRFAPPLQTPSDLRARFRDLNLRPDIAAILRQWGWPGNLGDIYQAAEGNEITEIRIPIGARMPFMSSRKNGKPILLRDVLWAGKEPIPAYAFTFSSKGRRYRCVTPKACSNFFLEDLGTPALALECNAPPQTLTGQRVEVCLTLRNTGNATEPKTSVTLPIPAGAEYINPTSGNQPAARQLAWAIPDLAPGGMKIFCASFLMRERGPVSFIPTARGELASPVQSTCSTTVSGHTAILLEVVDLVDPIEVGSDVTYLIKVRNQGSETGTNIRLTCVLPATQQFVSATGITPLHAQAGSLTTEALPELAPQAEASWRIVIKATQAADARFKVELASDQFQHPMLEQEATRQY